MIFTVTLILSSLVAINFLLLIFSCNKTSKRVDEKRVPRALKTEKAPKTLISNQSKSRQLAPTGS